MVDFALTGRKQIALSPVCEKPTEKKDGGGGRGDSAHFLEKLADGASTSA